MSKYFSSSIPDNPRNRKLLEHIRQAGLGYLGTAIPELPFSKYQIYFETGSRVEYEACYIDRRRRLNVYTALSISLGESVWLNGLEDILWAICNEFTWAFPAHIKDETDLWESSRTIDLFAAETGMAVSEACFLAGEKLSPLVRKRVEEEVKRRLLIPYQQRDIRFHKDNWSAVCAGCIAMAAMYWDGYEGYLAIEKKVLTSMKDFLDSYEADGCCLEGILYWGYGYGYFCYFAHMLRWFSRGKTDLFRSEKVKQMALFAQKISLGQDAAVPFADAPHSYRPHIGLIHLLAKEYDEVTLPHESCTCWFDDDIRHRFADFVRDLYWYDPALEKENRNEELVIFEKSQWYLSRRPLYSFAAKGGRNHEPHNHNDIGHFILYADGQFVLDDLGWPEYDSAYFTEKRYENLCASSFGHSVPILNGTGQAAGKEHRGSFMRAEKNFLQMDITRAYTDGTCRKLIREFALQNTSIRLTDHLEGVTGQVKERFITRIPPVIESPSSLTIGGWRLTADCTAGMFTAGKTYFYPRLSICRMDMKPVETVWCIDFIVKEPRKLTFLIEKIHPI